MIVTNGSLVAAVHQQVWTLAARLSEVSVTVPVEPPPLTAADVVSSSNRQAVALPRSAMADRMFSRSRSATTLRRSASHAAAYHSNAAVNCAARRSDSARTCAADASAVLRWHDGFATAHSRFTSA